MTGISYFNQLCSGLYDGLTYFSGPLGTSGQIWWVGLVLGAIVAAVFKMLINLPQLKLAQRALVAALYESWLYRQEPRVVLGANWALVRANYAYLRAFFPPLLLGTLLAAPLILQAHYHFGLRGIQPGDKVLLTAEFAGGKMATAPLRLDWAQGVGTISPPVRQPALGRVVWRIEPKGAGVLTLRLHHGSEAVEVPLFLRGANEVISTGLYSSGGDLLLAPRAEILQARSGFARVWIDYALSSPTWLGWITLSSLVGALAAHWGIEALRRTGPRLGPDPLREI